MDIKHISINGGIYFDVNTKQQNKLNPMLSPMFRITTNRCNTCACYTDKIIFNATICEMQCEQCFNDWSKCYILSEEDYKRQAYNAECVEKLLTKD